MLCALGWSVEEDGVQHLALALPLELLDDVIDIVIQVFAARQVLRKLA